MKKLLFATVMLPFICNAQNFEASANVGLSHNTMQGALMRPITIKPSYYFGIDYCGLKRVDFGLSYFNTRFDITSLNAYGFYVDVNFGKKFIFSLGTGFGLNNYRDFSKYDGYFISQYNLGQSKSYTLRLQLRKRIYKHIYANLAFMPSYSTAKTEGSYGDLQKYDLYYNPFLLGVTAMF